jgi:hypothetical protein
MNDEYLDFAKNLAEEAGDMMKQYFREETSLPDWKNPNDPVTNKQNLSNLSYGVQLLSEVYYLV